MDPTACWNELVLAIRRDDRTEMREYAESLQRWLDMGGFLPRGVTQQGAHEVLAMVLNPYGDKADHYYSPEAADWMCRTCGKCTDFCQCPE